MLLIPNLKLDPAGSVINWPPEPEYEIQDYGCADSDPDPKEMFPDPEHSLQT